MYHLSLNWKMCISHPSQMRVTQFHILFNTPSKCHLLPHAFLLLLLLLNSKEIFIQDYCRGERLNSDPKKRQLGMYSQTEDVSRWTATKRSCQGKEDSC